MTISDSILALINEANPTIHQLHTTEVVLSNPVEDSTTHHNTKATLTALPHSGYKGHTDVFYNRVDVSVVTPSEGIRSEEPFTRETVVATLNTHPTFPLEETDVSMTVPEFQVGDIKFIPLVSQPNSLGWNGQTEIGCLFGLPPNSDDLYNLMNHTLPRNLS